MTHGRAECDGERSAVGRFGRYRYRLSVLRSTGNKNTGQQGGDGLYAVEQRAGFRRTEQRDAGKRDAEAGTCARAEQRLAPGVRGGQPSLAQQRGAYRRADRIAARQTEHDGRGSGLRQSVNAAQQGREKARECPVGMRDGQQLSGHEEREQRRERRACREGKAAPHSLGARPREQQRQHEQQHTENAQGYPPPVEKLCANRNAYAHTVSEGGMLMAFDGFELFEPQVELLGRHLATIENHCGIVEYDETVLRARCRRCEVRIEGEGLHLTALTLGELAVEGDIRSVAFLPGEEGAE
ncbi:hypothetical protein DXB50_08095 [Butyricicoccus sp. OM04-18BH]|nr:hypothetical protein DW766_10415 [Butyricicoccus sp. AM29-23AC]RHV40889.1 hypothetical protein DXB50_08095 [Butyricicoccus sp. OM04-18BH]